MESYKIRGRPSEKIFQPNCLFRQSHRSQGSKEAVWQQQVSARTQDQRPLVVAIVLPTASAATVITE